MCEVPPSLGGQWVTVVWPHPVIAELMWTAPELLRRPGEPETPSGEGDTFRRHLQRRYHPAGGADLGPALWFPRALGGRYSIVLLLPWPVSGGDPM